MFMQNLKVKVHPTFPTSEFSILKSDSKIEKNQDLLDHLALRFTIF